jgi:GNAT superfamily N-acetyltransferase
MRNLWPSFFSKYIFMKQEEIKIISYQPEHQPYFEQINRSWFEKHFHTQPEPIDKFVLTEPEKAIIERGGAILLLSYNDKIVGTVGIKKVNATTYEFTKMAVEEEYRGKGLGKILSEAAIEKAKDNGC